MRHSSSTNIGFGPETLEAFLMDEFKPDLSRSELLAAVTMDSNGPVALAAVPNETKTLDQTCAGTKPVRSPMVAVNKRLGRFDILKKLGEGGMGAVFHARDSVNGQEVALKVLAAGCLAEPNALRRFEKEARLLEEAKSPHVANLLEVGTDGEVRYLVMEFVNGGDLRKWINKSGALDEASVLEIIGELSQALVTAHAKGMVHRDIKPENILLSEDDQAQRPVVKLTDFGLARHVDQSESLKLTQTGALLGTPYYMSPEQFTGAYEVSPATDVYSIGVTFYELLTGQRPFTATDPIQLATAHCFDTPTDIRKLSPQVSDATADLVRRMLAKLPGQRPPDASAVLEEILRLQSGDSAQFVIHPLLPPHNTEAVVHGVYEFDLFASSEALWPYVSNTDRFNQAAGLQPVTYETQVAPDGRLRKFGQFKLAGVSIRWEEHPFEWVEGQRFSVLREFPTGPFVWFMNTVELTARPDGTTHLTHEAKIQPRGWLGRLFAKSELGPKGEKKVGRIYRRIDNIVSGKQTGHQVVDAFRQTPAIKRTQRQRLEDRLGQLGAADVSNEIVEVFRELIVNAAPQDVARLRPLSIARRFGLPEQEVVDACLRAVPLGLFTLHWDIICPTCRLASGTKATLREIEQHGNCEACQTKFNVEFSSSIELIFRVHPEVRASDAKTYCAGGPGNFPHVVAQVRLQPGERLMLPLSLNSGSYIARGPSLPYAIPIDVATETGLRHGQVRCVPGSNKNPVAMLRSGHQNLALENFFPGEQLIRIERTIRRSEALTAAQATTVPLFRELFPDQTLSPGLLVEVATSNFLAIQYAGLKDAFTELGDAQTYTLVQEFGGIVERLIHRSGGSVVDRSIGTIVSSYADPVTAIETARLILPALLAEKPDRPWSLSGALHRGPALVTGDRQEVKYFGSTINRVHQLARDASTNRLSMTPEIWSDPAVIAALPELSTNKKTKPSTADGVQRISLNNATR